ncbi:ABC transporter permease [Streptomyces sp. NPDC092296]|uniref:ABC transporter permease n=1 Tax=Streptomyces sp. NPDC092296 TaxID=3366012 RepID=UPI00381955B9
MTPAPAATRPALPGSGTPAPADPAALAAFAARHGLVRPGARPPLPAYLRLLWGRRHFTTAYAQARLSTMYGDARLGQLWKVLTPVLNIAVYYLIFGLLLQQKHNTGTGNYISFLCIGIFVFTYTRESVTTGGKSVADRLDLIRAAHFPRACLPLAAVLVQLEQLVMSLLVVGVIVLATGEPLTTAWLLAIPALALQTLFNVGLALVLARVVATVRDLGEVVPFVMRTWMYSCGVMYSIDTVTRHAPTPVALLLKLNPGAVYLELIRGALLDSYPPIPLWTWAVAAGWALLTAVVGFTWFWQAEARYARG